MNLLSGVVGFNTADGFGMVLETWLTSVLVNVKGLGGVGELRELIGSNRSFPVMSTLSIVLEIFRHILDFRSIVSCFGFGLQTCGWIICMTTLATNFVSCLAVNVNVICFELRESFWLTVVAYVFWLLTTCCLNACFLYSGHPLYDATCGPLQLAQFGFLASLLGHPL